MGLPITQPVTGRIIRNLSNGDYHGDKNTYSSSLIKKMDVPARAKAYMDNPPEYKETLNIGSAIHKWILERDQFREDFLIGINAARRSKDDKQLWADWYTSKGADGEKVIDRPAADWNTEFERQTGKHMVTPDTLREITAMAESVASNETAVELLTGGESEISMYWRNEATGLDLRIRPDYLSQSFISDLKSAADVSDYMITRAIKNFGYHLSQAMYQDGVKQVTGEWLPFLFIFVEKEAPYICRVIALDDTAASAGWDLYQQNMLKLKQCLDTGIWESLPNNLEFSLPDWAL